MQYIMEQVIWILENTDLYSIKAHEDIYNYNYQANIESVQLDLRNVFLFILKICL